MEAKRDCPEVYKVGYVGSADGRSTIVRMAETYARVPYTSFLQATSLVYVEIQKGDVRLERKEGQMRYKKEVVVLSCSAYSNQKIVKNGRGTRQKVGHSPCKAEVSKV